MIIYSVTVNIDKNIEQDWIQWMKEKHIPDVMNTGCFLAFRITKLLEPAPYDENTVTYNIQYTAKNLDEYNKYQKSFAPALQKEHSERYAGKFQAFRTLLEIV